MPFKYVTPDLNAAGKLVRLNAKASTQFAKGQACKLVDGILNPLSGQTDLCTHIFQWMDTPRQALRPATANLTTVADEISEAIPCAGNGLEFESPLIVDAAPPISNLTANAGGADTTTSVSITYNGTTGANDFQNGVIYFVERDTYAHITGSAYAGGIHTLTIEPPLATAPTTADHVYVVPFDVGSKPKFGATLPKEYISSAVADKSGGNVIVTKVDLKRLFVRLKFVDAP